MVLFPHTDIFSIRQFPLFLLTPTLRILRGWRGEQSSMTDCFTKAGFCQVEYPLPFAEESEEQRFARLITDIVHRKDDYAAQLGSLTLAGMTEHLENGEDSERTIIQSIIGEEEKQDIPHIKNLWQSRLLLALGEILDREQEAIDTELAQLDQTRQNLFHELHGNSTEEDPFMNFSQTTEEERRESRVDHLLYRAKAWQTLFMPYCRKVTEEKFLVTQRLERAEAFPETVCIPLPASIAETAEEACEVLTEFHKRNNRTASLWEKSPDAWNELMERVFPTQQYGRSSVYCIAV